MQNQTAKIIESIIERAIKNGFQFSYILPELCKNGQSIRVTSWRVREDGHILIQYSHPSESNQRFLSIELQQLFYRNYIAYHILGPQAQSRIEDWDNEEHFVPYIDRLNYLYSQLID